MQKPFALRLSPLLQATIASSALVATLIATMPLSASAAQMKHAKHTSLTHHVVVKKTVHKAMTTHTNEKLPRTAFQNHGITGTVASINGSSITLTASSTTYTIDASNAKFNQGFAAAGTTFTISNIQTGDRLMVQGTVSGTNVTATSIRDASVMGRNLFSGAVTAINGSSITLQSRGMRNSTPTTYTVDASNATITKGMGTTATTITVGTIAVKDHLMVAGTLSGTNITATSVTDVGVRAMMGRGTHAAGAEGGIWNK